MHACQDLDQRRLARAVVADEGHDLACMHVEINISQSRNGAEMLRDSAQTEHRFARVAQLLGSVHSSRTSKASFQPHMSGHRAGGRTEFADYWVMPSFLQPSA